MELIEHFSKGNVSEFAKSLTGITQQRLNRLFNLDTRTEKYPKIPSDVITEISVKYPNVNTNWLLTGEGTMLKNGDMNNGNNYLDERRNQKNGSKNYIPIPYHDIDMPAAESQNVEMYDDKGLIAEDYYYIPEFSGCRAFNCFSDSMEPLIKKGSKIFCRKLDSWLDYLEFGQVYVVGMLDGRRFLKYIKKGTKKDRFLLQSANTHYEEFEVPLDKIRSIWLIDGYMDKVTQSTFFVLKYPNENPQIKINDEPVMPYGKYAGKPLSEVPDSYWRFMLQNEKLEGEIKKYAEERVQNLKSKEK